ncbi:hypothetical protein VKT23_011788 [Stygiomarasmius scandens]|uniref:Uncharacterized protein n=1 Tax=Marasmiellus scandens TaxID=2682957 RepID=A0ABR1J821_9AGAR
MLSHKLEEPTWSGRAGPRRPALSTATTHALRNMLKKSFHRTTQSDVAIETIQLQTKLWEEEVARVQSAIEKKDDSLSFKICFGDVDVDLARAFAHAHGYLGEDLQQHIQVILEVVATSRPAADSQRSSLGKRDAPQSADSVDASKIWGFYKLPYIIRCAGLALSREKSSDRVYKKVRRDGDEEIFDDIDEWILRNEQFLRLLSKIHKISGTLQTPFNSEINESLSSWQYGLIRIQDLKSVIPSSTFITAAGSASPELEATALKITRPSSLPGYTVLDAKRPTDIYVQKSTSAFSARFDCMTQGLLEGLDWGNIFVAGGIVLGALLTPEKGDHKQQDERWISSDIDLYIYGLGVEEANEKIKHVAEVYKRNLKSNSEDPSSEPFLLVRNSQTITIYSSYPNRRVQIVLKLVKSPREVLLNFDLDICAVGYDGREVWMLPRFVRALETGTNVFTMDLVNGHYLGDRKATRDKRIFKYANRGYGLRIIPLYLGYIAPYTSSENEITSQLADSLKDLSLGEDLYAPPLKLSVMAETAREWTRKTVEMFIKLGQKSGSRPFWFPHRRWPPVQTASGKPVFSHAMLESYHQINWEPLGRSCLTGFMLFMRHVTLWEMECEGTIEIYQHIFAEDAYNNLGEVAYDDTPMYEWNSSFSLSNFKQAIDKFNENERRAAENNLMYLDNEGSDDLQSALRSKSTSRISYASSVEELFGSEKDIVLPITTEPNFVKYANRVVKEGLESAGFHNQDLPILDVGFDQSKDKNSRIMVLWKLTKVLNWQMVDRRIDEVREMLWAFHRSNERAAPEPEMLVELLHSNISKRAIRTSEADESNAFIRWVGRRPYRDPERNSEKLNGLFLVAGMNGLSMDDEDE